MLIRLHFLGLSHKGKVEIGDSGGRRREREMRQGPGGEGKWHPERIAATQPGVAPKAFGSTPGKRPAKLSTLTGLDQNSACGILELMQPLQGFGPALGVSDTMPLALRFWASREQRSAGLN